MSEELARAEEALERLLRDTAYRGERPTRWRSEVAGIRARIETLIAMERGLTPYRSGPVKGRRKAFRQIGVETGPVPPHERAAAKAKGA